jgi:RNA polymerase sigma factor (sigma-70 family)
MTGRPDQSDAARAVAEAASSASDEALLAQFVRERSECAFAALVRRHGPLVLGVCRRVLADVHDADDAFQSTFLVLALRAADIRRRDALGAWLYGVAFRTARRLAARRRRQVVLSLPVDLPSKADPLADVAARHDRHVLDEELNRLPPKHRDVLVLHYLLGKPQQAVARELGESVAAVDGRIKRARRRLRVRLAARGVTAGTLAALALLKASGEAVWPSLVAATARTGAGVAGGGASFEPG